MSMTRNNLFFFEVVSLIVAGKKKQMKKFKDLRLALG